MNTTLVIFHILAISIYSIAKPTEVATETNIEDSNSTGDFLPELVRNDDVIRSSELIKVYSSIENKFGKTRLLKDETDDIGKSFILERKDLKKENRNRVSKGPGDDQHDKSIATTEAVEIETEAADTIETKSANNNDNNSDTDEVASNTEGTTVENSNSTTKQESKTGEKIDSTNNKSKAEQKEESKAIEVTSELNQLEKTTTSNRRQVKDKDYSGNNEDVIGENVTDGKHLNGKGYKNEMTTNDESNSSWDVLDDIPISRRMLSRPNNMIIDVNTKSDNEVMETVEARRVPEPRIPPSNRASHVNMCCVPTSPGVRIPQHRTTAPVPHIHTTWLPNRRLIVPGFLKTRPPVNIDYRRLMDHQRNNIIHQNKLRTEDQHQNVVSDAMNQNQNAVFDAEVRSEIPPSMNFVPDNLEDVSNEYPYTPNGLDIPRQTTGVNPLIIKLIEASEHPNRYFNPNVNVGNVQAFPNIPYNYHNNYDYPNIGGNVQNYPGIPYNNFLSPNTYAAPQNYGVYKFLT